MTDHQARAERGDWNVEMKRLWVLLFLMGCSTMPQETGFPTRGVTTEHTIITSEGERYYRQFVPSKLSVKKPLVILLHGGTGSMHEVIEEGRATARWPLKAQEEGFVLLVPNGTNYLTDRARGRNQRWNDDRIFDGSSVADDVGFLLKLVDLKVKQGLVDPDNVFVTGASNGGMMVFRLLAERPDVFSAGASTIANLPDIAQRPPPKKPVLMFFGDKDTVMPFEGGPVSIANLGNVVSQEQTLKYWLKGHGLEMSDGRAVDIPDRNISDGCSMTRTDWGPRSAPLVSSVIMKGGGHTLPHLFPRIQGALGKRFIGNVCADVEVVDEVWTFFSAHLE